MASLIILVTNSWISFFKVDSLVRQNHLFKRSIILIKAWCYYESRILGAHHGLISTYALETLVLYIFHVFNNSFAGPLEVSWFSFDLFQFVLILIFHLRAFALCVQVLYRFLEFFSKFDWDNFCVGLWGPVPIRSLPDMTGTLGFLMLYPTFFLTEWQNCNFFAIIGSDFFFLFKYLAADPPRKDGGELLLSKLFLNACSSVYSAFPMGPENLELPFMSKHFNVIDPLRANNNLGRSVSKGTSI